MAAVVSPSFRGLQVPDAPSRRQALRCGAAAALLLAGGPAAWAQGQGQKQMPPGAAAQPAMPSLAFELVTPAEAARDRELRPKNEALDMPEVTRSRSMPGAAAAPAALAIRVLTPTSQASVTAPLRIELAFEAPPGVRVVPASFRVLYGVLKIDLTERLRRFSTISERGVVVDQAVVPDGLHRLYLQVADDKGNMAEQELRLRVGVVS